ncbi:MAG: ABC transporter ATP-binding protein [Anaerolineae bacterium]
MRSDTSSVLSPGSGSEPSPIVVENLTKRFGEFTAVDNVSFDVRPGEVFGWLGPNGAGKTTTIRILLGLLKPTSGSTFVLGFNSATQTKAVHARVGYMSQQFTLYNDLTAAENLRFYGGVHGLSSAELRERLPQILRMAGLEGRADELTQSLSGGWKQRLALGCAIIHRPRVVFLDEPTAGVDPISRREFWELIYGMADEGVAVLVTTHYMEEAELCQRIGLINQGRLVSLDSPARLKRLQMRGRVLELTVSEPERGMRILKGAQESGQIPLEEVALFGAQIHAVVSGGQDYKEAVRSLLESQDVRVQALDWISPTLEDVFISAVTAPKAA